MAKRSNNRENISKYKNGMIMGDFNFRWNKTEETGVKKLEKLMDEFGMEQMVKEPRSI